MGAGMNDARRLIVTALAVLGGLALAAPVHAAFPGANGRIMFTRCDTTGCSDADIWTIAADASKSDGVASSCPSGPLSARFGHSLVARARPLLASES